MTPSQSAGQLNPKNQQNSENELENLNTSMSSWWIWIIFDLERSAWCALKFISYTRLDMRTPS